MFEHGDPCDYDCDHAHIVDVDADENGHSREYVCV